MSGLTLAEATALKEAAYAAYMMALNSRSYRTGNFSKESQEIKDLKNDFLFWSAKVDELTEGGIVLIGATPL